MQNEEQLLLTNVSNINKPTHSSSGKLMLKCFCAFLEISVALWIEVAFTSNDFDVTFLRQTTRARDVFTNDTATGLFPSPKMKKPFFSFTDFSLMSNLFCFRPFPGLRGVD